MKTITKQEALQAIDDIYDNCEEIVFHLTPEEDTGYRMFPDYVKVKHFIESYESEEEWISCEDDLPKKPSVVYCYCHDPKLGGRWTETLYYNHGLWCKPDGLVFTYEVLAWYPLPKKPYKEKRMMTLDEAITHCEEVADYDCYNEEQMKCANEHRQLAKWLTELKELKSLQTAKKPKWKAEDRFVKNRFQQFPYCPHCGYEITTGDCHCRVCGQHIDWEEDDAE